MNRLHLWQLLMPVLLLTALQRPAHAATRLDLTQFDPVDVEADFEFSPNGQWLVFRASTSDNSSAELYCLAATGGIPVRLSANLPSDRAIASWELSFDGSRVVYFADQDTPNRDEVYVVPMPDGAYYKVNDTLVDAGSKGGGFAGASASQIAYIASKVTGDFIGTVYELFSVPTIGGESIRLSGPMVTGGDVQKSIVSSDGERVLYLADQDLDEKLELYGASLSGNTSVKLSQSINDQSKVVKDGVAFSPDGSRVIYQVDWSPESRVELYSVSSLGGAAVPLNSPLPNGGDVTRGSQRFSPDGLRVLYHADQNADEVFEIFSVPSGGGAPVALNGPLVEFGDVIAAGLQFSSDSARVLYTADQNLNEVFELFSVPSVGGASVKLSGEMITTGDVQADPAFSPDGSRVVYRADGRIDDVIELFGNSSTGGLPTVLNAPLVAHGNVIRAAFTPDGSQVVYLADQDANDVFELYAVAATGGAVRKLSGPLVAGGDVRDWQFSPDGSELVYRADQDVDQLFQLYSVDWSGAAEALPGDFNRDGVVDAADYTKWRDGLGTLYTVTDYTNWKNNFGRRSASGSGGSTEFPVPEPQALTLCAFTFVLAIGSQGRRMKPRRLT